MAEEKQRIIKFRSDFDTKDIHWTIPFFNRDLTFRVPRAFLFIIAYIRDAEQHLVVLISWNRAPNSFTYKQGYKDKNMLTHSIRSPNRIYGIKWSIHRTTHRY